MRSLLRQAILLATAAAAATTALASSSTRTLPAKRTYDTHHYYAIETRSDYAHVDPRDVADLLGADFVERVGELEHHWLVRAEKDLSAQQPRSLDGSGDEARAVASDDAVLRRWSALSHARHLPTHGLSKRHHDAAMAIRAVDKQVLRRRHKRDKIYSPWDTPHLYPRPRDPLPGPEPRPYPDPLPRPPPIPDAKTVQMAAQFDIHDPIFTEQWHLANDRTAGNDLNISGVWEQKITGEHVNVALIDDGLDMHSPDLKDNFFAAGSYDFNAHTALPEPRESDDQHGTRCAGEIAAVKNDVCGVGVAYKAHVAGLRILSGPISDVDEAAALNYGYQDNAIYSCSWGPPDDGKSMDAPKGLIAKAILNGVQNGRGGKGSIFVFAGGNGGASDDQCNFDGYTNSIYTMTIAAVDRENLHPYYSEMCSANLASGWSSGSNDHIHTTDVAWNGINRCTTHHGGTSAAAPLVAGVAALALQIRPDLTWRDMQHIAVHSAQMINPQDPDWQKTQAGRYYNHKFGYGVISAYAFIEEAKTHKLVKPQAWFESGNRTIPADETYIGEGGVKNTFTITQAMLDAANLETVEHVTVRVWITHERRGDVDVELVSPHGTKSVLARPRRFDDATTGFPGWGFMSLKHWDESPVGDWTIQVFDQAHPKQTGNFWAWSMTLWGQALDPAKAKPWNFPENSLEYHETLAAAPSSTPVQGVGVSGASSDKYKPSKPTDHLPSDHGSQPGESHQDFTNPSGSAAAASPEGDTGYLTGLKKNSTWLFVAFGLVIIFAGSVGAFFALRRRSRRRRGLGGGAGSGGGRGAGGRAGEYEFVPTEGDEDMDEMQMGRLEGRGGRGLAATQGGTGRRTREIYDAFRAASEDGFASSSDDDEHGGERAQLGKYRDEPEEKRGEEEEEEDQRFTIGAEGDVVTPVPGGGGAAQAAAAKEGDLLGGSTDEKDADKEKDTSSSGGSGSGSGSWQDATLD